MDSLSPSLVEEESSEAYKNVIILSTPKQRRECKVCFLFVYAVLWPQRRRK
ncbi:MAG: hypothetical protein ACJ71K_19295 [Nitrososphaeraceae archaeon]